MLVHCPGPIWFLIISRPWFASRTQRVLGTGASNHVRTPCARMVLRFPRVVFTLYTYPVLPWSAALVPFHSTPSSCLGEVPTHFPSTPHTLPAPARSETAGATTSSSGRPSPPDPPGPHHHARHQPMTQLRFRHQPACRRLQPVLTWARTCRPCSWPLLMSPCPTPSCSMTRGQVRQGGGHAQGLPQHGTKSGGAGSWGLVVVFAVPITLSVPLGPADCDPCLLRPIGTITA